MRFWLVVVVLLAGGAVVWWVRRRTAMRYADWLLRRGAGDPVRAARAVLVSQSIAVAAAVAALAVGVLSEQWNGWFWVRIPLCAAVIGLYVPLATALAPARFRWQRSAASKLLERGASVGVAQAIAARARVFAAIGSVVFLAAVIALTWHHLRH